MCTPEKESTGVGTAVLLLVKGVWLLLSRVAAPLAVVVAVLAFRWFSGAPMRPTWKGRRLVTRPVRAVAQSLATALAVALWLFPLVTVVLMVMAAGALSFAAMVVRRRVFTRRPAVRVYIDELTAVTDPAPALTCEPVRAWESDAYEKTGVRR